MHMPRTLDEVSAKKTFNKEKTVTRRVTNNEINEFFSNRNLSAAIEDQYEANLVLIERRY